MKKLYKNGKIKSVIGVHLDLKSAIIYLLIINILAAVVTMVDKRKSIKGKWRVSEKNLFAIALLGGSVGMYITMRIIRHKTRHNSFMIGLPFIFILQAAIFWYLFKF